MVDDLLVNKQLDMRAAFLSVVSNRVDADIRPTSRLMKS